MLVLNRRLGENIQIGHDTKISILSIKGNQVKVGVDAPRTIPVYREEIYRKIWQNKNTCVDMHVM